MENTKNNSPVEQERITEEPNKPIIGKVRSFGTAVIVYAIIQIVGLPIYLILLKDKLEAYELLPIIPSILILILGIQIKKARDTNMKKVKRISIFLIIYSICMILLAMSGGNTPSPILVILLYQSFQMKKEINTARKEALEDDEEEDNQSSYKIDSKFTHKKSRKKTNLKNWIIISITVVISIIIIYVLKQEHDTSTNKSESSIEYQREIPKDWNIVNIKDLGTIAIPKTLEVREEGSTLDSLNKYNVGKIVIQQTGLNKNTDKSFATYARVIINIREIKDEKVPRKHERLNLSTKELNDMKTSMLSTQNMIWGLLNCTIEDMNAEEVYINNMGAIKFSYLRQCRDNPQVYVEIYEFSNYNQIIEITLSYRISESDIWKEDFSQIIKTFILKD